MTRQLIAALISFAAWCTSISAAGVKYVDPTAGLPDYEKQPAFTINDQATIEALRAQVRRLVPNPQNCTTGRVKVWPEWTHSLRSNVCNADDLRTLRRLVTKLAPVLKPDRLTFWVGELDRSKAR